MKSYEISQGRKDYQEPFTENFEAIYERAKEEEISLSNAKSFLHNLSPDELKTLQNYTGLADPINIDKITDEGAYNLLVHDKEQYDFNGDGVAQVGEANMMLPIPINMPTGVRDAYITAMNSLSGEERLRTSMLTLDPAHLTSKIYDEEFTPTRMDYDYLKTAVENALNPKGGGFTSEDTKVTIRAFWDAFESAYTGDISKKEDEYERSDELKQFLHDLRTKGAAQFLADMNQEKIDKLVEEFEEKLRKEMGDSPEALEEIAQLVEDYRKQLMEEMMEKTQEDKMSKGEKTMAISSDTIVQDLINLQQKDNTNPLEELLQQ